MTSLRLRRTAHALLLALLSTFLLTGVSAPATAATSPCLGQNVPLSKISIQLFTFAGVIGGGDGAAARQEEVLRRLAEMGYRNVEPYTLSGLTAEQYRAMLDRYGLKASSRHVSIGTPSAPADIEAILEENRVLGIKHFGAGSTPRDYTTEAEWAAYGQFLESVGEQARKAGQTLMVHNHHWEFRSLDTGRTGYDVLVTNTSKKNVSFQLDVYWAAFAGADPVDVVERYGNRIQLLHVKDLNEDLNRRIEIVGRGDVDFPAVFDAAGGSTKYYVVEHDPRRNDPTFDPFEAAQVGFDYLTCKRA